MAFYEHKYGTKENADNAWTIMNKNAENGKK